mgnify:CR=1 FL=1
MLITEIKGIKLLKAITRHKIDISQYNNEKEIRSHLNRIARNKHYGNNREKKQEQIRNELQNTYEELALKEELVKSTKKCVERV